MAKMRRSAKGSLLKAQVTGLRSVRRRGREEGVAVGAYDHRAFLQKTGKVTRRRGRILPSQKTGGSAQWGIVILLRRKPGERCPRRGVIRLCRKQRGEDTQRGAVVRFCKQGGIVPPSCFAAQSS